MDEICSTPGETGIAYKNLVGKLERTIQLWRRRGR